MIARASRYNSNEFYCIRNVWVERFLFFIGDLLFEFQMTHLHPFKTV